MKGEIQLLIDKIDEICDDCECISSLWDGDDSGHLEEQTDEYKDIKFWLEQAREDLEKARDVQD